MLPITRDDIMDCLARSKNHGPVLGALAERETGCVDAALYGAWTRCLYASDLDHGDEVDRLQFATYLLHSLAKARHCFTDANKRVAWFAAMEVLATASLTIDASQADAADFVLGIAESNEPDEVVLRHAAEWLAERLVPYGDAVSCTQSPEP